MKKLLSVGICIIILSILTGCSAAAGYYKDGKKSFQNKDYEAAAEYFLKAISDQPERADYYIDYAMTLIVLGDYEQALSQLEHAYVDKDMKSIRENNKRVIRGKGLAYYFMQEYEKALVEFDRALQMKELSQLNMDILYYKGDTLRRIGSYDKAIETYNAVIDKDSKNALAYGCRALCYYGMGNYEKSLEDYDKAISLKPDYYDFYFGKYYLVSERRNHNLAAEVLKQAEEIKAKTKEDRFNRSKVYYLQGDYETATYGFEESYLEGFAEAYYYIGEIHRNKKDYSKAMFYYEGYMEAGTVSSPEVYNQMAVCLMKTGDYKKALEYLEKGLTFNYADSIHVLMKNEIIAYEHLGMFEKAQTKLTEYLKDYPEDTKALVEAEFIKTRQPDISSMKQTPDS